MRESWDGQESTIDDLGTAPSFTPSDRASRRPVLPLARRHRDELLDGRGWTMAELRSNLRDIRRVNRLGGGTAAVLRSLPDLLVGIPAVDEVEILDLATGSADIPRAVVRWAERQGRRVRVVASDLSEDVLAVAREQTRGRAGIELATYDARSVPLADQTVDVALCSMALHHFEPADAIKVLGEMRRLVRCGFIVNDLVRCRAGYAAAVVTSRLLTRNRLTRHDAPLSVLRAYTPVELEDLLRQAGVEGAVVRRHPLFRMVAVWKKPA